MKNKGLFAVLLSILLLTFPPLTTAATYTWTNTAGGNWNQAANWSPNGVPGGSDSAAITTTGSYTVTVNDTEAAGTLTLGAASGDQTAQALNLSGGALTINSASSGTAQGTLNVSGGTLGGAGALTLAGPLNWTGGQINGMVQFSGGSINGGLNLYGALVNSGTLAWSGTLYMYGGTITNLGTINVAAGTSASTENGSPDLDNEGQFNATGNGTSTINIPFNNSGTVTVNGGSLNLTDGGTEGNSFTVAAGTAVELSGGTFTLNSGYAISGAGALTVNGATANFSGSANVTSILNLSGGTINLNGSNPITPSAANITGGTEQGSQPLQIAASGGFSWTGGQINGLVQLNGGSINGGLNLYGALVNSGTLAWNGTLYMYGGVITNLGTLNLAAGTGAATENGSPDLDNEGQFNVTGNGTSIINIPFNNSGIVALNGGTLNLAGGGTEGASFTVASGATLQLSGSTFNLNSGCAISGAGALTVNGATANFSGSANVTSILNLSGGTINLNGSNPITPSAANITGGTEQGSQPLQIAASGGFSWTGGQINGLVQLNGGSINGELNLYGALVNSGTLAWNGNLYMYGGVITNLGTINLAAGSGTFGENGSPDLDNDGQFNVAGTGASTINIAFNNYGTVAVNGGTFNLGGGGTATNSFLVASGATLNLDGGAFTFDSSSSILGPGNFTVSSGNASLGGTCNVGGTYTFSGGSANMTGACTMTNNVVISGGVLNLNGSGQTQPLSVSITGGTEAGSQPLQVTGSGGFSWTGGQVNGTVHFNGGSINGGLNLYGALVNSGTLAWNGNLYMYGGVLTNLGTMNVAPGSGATTENGSPAFDNAGQFNVSGPGTTSFNFPFNNTGTVNIQSGKLSLPGGYTSVNGALNFGISSSNSYGTLTLSGPFAANGALGAMASGYSPNPGDTFPLITYGSEGGIFSAFNLPGDASWQVNYGSTVFAISVFRQNPSIFTLQAVTPAQITNGFTLLMLGPIGSNYLLQAASDPILSDWITLTNFTTVDTSFYYTDTTATNYLGRFFRAVMLR